MNRFDEIKKKRWRDRKTEAWHECSPLDISWLISEIERLRKYLKKVKLTAEREGCNHSGCDNKWHTSLCPLSYVEIAQQALKEESDE